MRITQIERINVEIPYLEHVRQHLQKACNFGNQATDDDFHVDQSTYLEQS